MSGNSYYGNHLGLVVNSSDPEYRGRVQVFVPHIMPALYEGWNEQGVDIDITCVGSNIPQGMTSDLHSRLVKILPWAESASPIIGGSSPGNLFTDVYTGVKNAVGSAASAVSNFFNQGPTAQPVPVEGGDASALIDKAKGISGLSFDGSKWGKCARGTTALDKAAGLIDNNGASAGFYAASDLAAGGTNKTGYNPYTTGTGAKYFQPAFTVDPSTYKPQIGDSVYAGGGGGDGHGHAQKVIGFDKQGEAIWASDNVQSKFFTSNKTASYNNFTVYRLNDEGLKRYSAAVGGKVSDQEPPSTTTPEQAADSSPAAANNLAKKDGLAEVSPDPQTIATEGGSTGTASGGTSSGSGLYSDNFANFVKSKEGFYGSSYWDYKQHTVGYGTKAKFAGETITKEEAESRLRLELDQAATQTNSLLQRKGINLTQSQKESLMSFTYNGGVGMTQSLLDGGGGRNDWASISEGMKLYNKAGGKELAGLTNRRNDEIEFANTNGAGGFTSSELTAATPATSIINNTDDNGRTPVLNTNDMPNGMFAYPNPGAMVWVFFREGNPLYPVYFAASYSATEWKNAYRGGSEGDLMSHGENDPTTKITSSVMKLHPAATILAKEKVSLSNPQDNEAVFSLCHQHGSNITFKNGCDFHFSRNNKRDEVDNDRFVLTKGYKEQWTQGDESSNTRGNQIIKIGNISQEAIDAMNELANMSYEMNQVLMSK